MGDDARALGALDSTPRVGLVRLAFSLVLFLPFGLLASWCWWRDARTSSSGVGARRWSLAAIITGAVLSAILFVLLGLLGAFPRS